MQQMQRLHLFPNQEGLGEMNAHGSYLKGNCYYYN